MPEGRPRSGPGWGVSRRRKKPFDEAVFSPREEGRATLKGGKGLKEFVNV